VLGLSENKIEPQSNSLDEHEKNNEDNLFDNKHFVILDALTHLTNRVIADLEASNNELKATQNKLTEQANRDYLTNRRYFNEIANDFIALSKRDKKPISVIMLDIDNFKQINDEYGHTVGDEVLKSLALILVNSTRDSDIVSRFGGEEFSILLPLTGVQPAFKLAEKFRLLFKMPGSLAIV
ncbi:MAG TPA: GGDEF domain-containing protein, partial [Psychromonas sp.]